MRSSAHIEAIPIGSKPPSTDRKRSPVVLFMSDLIFIDDLFWRESDFAHLVKQYHANAHHQDIFSIIFTLAQAHKHKRKRYRRQQSRINTSANIFHALKNKKEKDWHPQTRTNARSADYKWFQFIERAHQYWSIYTIEWKNVLTQDEIQWRLDEIGINTYEREKRRTSEKDERESSEERRNTRSLRS